MTKHKTFQEFVKNLDLLKNGSLNDKERSHFVRQVKCLNHTGSPVSRLLLRKIK